MSTDSDKAKSSEADADKAARITRVMNDVLTARASGKLVDYESLMQNNADLMPDLADALKGFERVKSARAAAEAAPTITPEMERLAQAVREEFERPLIQAPGYSIDAELARGGQSIIYLATQLSTGRRVVVKVLRDGPLADERALARFKREAQILATLNHPNIVTVLDAGRTTDGSRFIVMDYIGGRTLDEFMQDRHRRHPDDPSKLLRLFLKICAAVSAAHLRGVVHRDLKPSNIRIDDRGEPHILDFGLARTALDRFNESITQPVSITGEFLGSLPWSSPEQAEGDSDKIDLRTDVYSLGVILYQMLTGGRFPYTVVGNIRDVLNNILTAEPTPPSKVLQAHDVAADDDPRQRTIRPSLINETMERIVLKTLAKRPDDRYQSASELGRAVADYLSGRSPATAIQESPSIPSDESQRGSVPDGSSGRVSKIAAIGAVSVIALLAVGVFVFKRRSPVATDATTNIPSASQPAPLDHASEKTVPPARPTTLAPQEKQAIAAPAPIREQGIPADAVAHDGRHFKFYDETIGWHAADQRCAELGGHLARPESADLQAFLQNLKGEGMTAWLGGRRDTSTSRWTWTNQHPIDPAGVESPLSNDFDCLFLARNGKLSSRPASGHVEGAAVPNIQGFFCEWDR